jgi:hypothetical protein
MGIMDSKSRSDSSGQRGNSGLPNPIYGGKKGPLELDPQKYGAIRKHLEFMEYGSVIEKLKADPEAMSCVIKCLSYYAWDVRKNAAWALHEAAAFKYQIDVIPALPALANAIWDDYPEVREAASSALKSAVSFADSAGLEKVVLALNWQQNTKKFMAEAEANSDGYVRALRIHGELLSCVGKML